MMAHITCGLGGGRRAPRCVIYLPASQQTVPPAPVSAVSRARWWDSGRILVMDDDDFICDLLQASACRAWGMRSSASTTAARPLLRTNRRRPAGQPFAAVILDSTIPGGMGGRETVTHLRTLNPQVVALLSSGYAHASMMATPAQEGFCGIVAKPYTVEKLQEALRCVLPEGHGTPEHTEVAATKAPRAPEGPQMAAGLLITAAPVARDCSALDRRAESAPPHTSRRRP